MIKINHNPERPIYKCEDSKNGCPEKTKGLGDYVERVAQPIAKRIDKVFGTNIQNCGGCKKRKKWLNKKTIKS